MAAVRLVTLSPGHFHAALVQKEMYPGVDPTAHVYAPLDADLLAHLARIHGFNSRKHKPSDWRLEVHAGPDCVERCLREKAGNVLVLSGRNRGKIDWLKAGLEAGFHVLADKPWVLRSDDLPTLRAALAVAAERKLIAYDIMTERHEITSIVQRALVNDRAVFGEPLSGTADEPAVYMESVHFLSKLVAGVPLRRPAWFFDVEQQGEGLTDVGTHLVDLVMWILFPDQAIAESEVQVERGERWPTWMTRADFQKVTGEPDFPDYLRPQLDSERLAYFCNTRVGYTVRGIHVKFDVLWDFESPGGGDTHLAIFRGSRASVAVRQGKEQNYRPEVYVVPNQPGDRSALGSAVEQTLQRLQEKYPGLALVEAGDDLHVAIPDAFRIGHEAHFGEVTRDFLQYQENPASLPAWEYPNLLAKYRTTTEGVRLARSS